MPTMQKKKQMIMRDKNGKKRKEVKKVEKGPQYKLANRIIEVDPKNAKTYSGKRTSCGYRKT